MIYWYDSEFAEDGKIIDFISIGVVSEDGKEFYAVSNEFNESACNDFVKENVLPYLPEESERKSKEQIKKEFLDFIGKDKDPQFWASYGSYDWIVICQLFGTMMDLPETFPKFVRDIQQLRAELGNPEYPKQEKDEHHALADAHGCKAKYEFLMDLKNKKKTANRFRNIIES